MILRTEEGAWKWAFRDFLREAAIPLFNFVMASRGWSCCRFFGLAAAIGVWRKLEVSKLVWAATG